MAEQKNSMASSILNKEVISALLQVSCASLKIITVSLYITLLFLAKIVTLFLLIIFINELNKAGVFETVAEAVPCHAQLQDPEPVWGSIGIGSLWVSYILPLTKCRCPKLKLVVGQ